MARAIEVRWGKFLPHVTQSNHFQTSLNWCFLTSFEPFQNNLLLVRIYYKEVDKAVPIFIFVSRPREGRFLAFHQEKKTKECFYVLSRSVKLEDKIRKKLVSHSFFPLDIIQQI